MVLRAKGSFLISQKCEPGNQVVGDRMGLGCKDWDPNCQACHFLS